MGNNWRKYFASSFTKKSALRWHKELPKFISLNSLKTKARDKEINIWRKYSHLLIHQKVKVNELKTRKSLKYWVVFAKKCSLQGELLNTQQIPEAQRSAADWRIFPKAFLLLCICDYSSLILVTTDYSANPSLLYSKQMRTTEEFCVPRATQSLNGSL